MRSPFYSAQFLRSCGRHLKQHLHHREKSISALTTKSWTTLKDLVATKLVPESNIRNIGIIAHIDAGKTTTTEQMLFASGLTRQCGSVDSGDTVMDYLPQERERGITINSAMITFPWKGFRVNLIDTPGHVDFTVEVERSLLAMDGVVIILDASKGVQAQTQTVWRQASKFGLPALVYLNKMDKPAANVARCVEQLEKRLGLKTLPLQVPVGSGKTFSAAHDILASGPLEDQLRKPRHALLETLADCDDDFADLYLNENLDDVTVESMIRQLCLSRKLCPMLVGSSLRETGVTQLLDAVTKYLPSPLESHNAVISEKLANSSGFCGLAFKNVHDKQKGLLTFLRLYRGNLKAGSSLYNVNKQRREKVHKIMEVFADEFREVPEASEGNIVVVSGFKETITGDTLVDAGHEEDSTEHVTILHIPEPVFFCSVEAATISQQQALEDALNIIQKEDPSLKVTVDADLGQLVVSGLGELHLEVIQTRLKQEFGLEVSFGPLQVAYKETPTKVSEFEQHLVREVQMSHQRVDVHLRLRPTSQGGNFKRLKLVKSQDFEWSSVPKEMLHAVENGVRSGLSNGVLLGCPVIDVEVELLKLSTARGTLSALVAAAATHCVQQLLRESQCQVLQPLMMVSISVPTNLVHDIMADLARRRAQIKDVDVLDEDIRTITAEVPLAEMLHFSRDIRTVSHGLALFTLEFGRYEPISSEQYERLRQHLV